ncbi:MAG: HEAT repeat domain-containing protein [Acidobacteria bacterium]|nr:HEAT repeat domain-containing protein [Acidobacteriota bacterium]
MKPLEILDNTPPWEWPPDAAKTLKNTMENRRADEDDRVLATELAGDLCVMDDEIGNRLLAILCDRSEPEVVRAAAAISMGPALQSMDELEICGRTEYDEPPVSDVLYHKLKQALQKTFRDPAEPDLVRRRCLEASVRAIQDWHTDAVRECWGKDDEEWKLTAVFCMGYVQGFDTQILEALHSDNPWILHHAVRAAGEQAVEEAWPRIRAILADPKTDKMLLLTALEAVSNFEHPEFAIELDPFLDSPDEDIREAALEAVQTLQSDWGLGEDDDALDEDDLDEDEEEQPPRRTH